MDGTIAEIRLFAAAFAPRNWAFCSGQIINIASNTALFALLGTTYGGNGSTTYALPDLRGRAARGVGIGAGLNPVDLGQTSGQPTNSLLTINIPLHTHFLAGAATLAVGGTANTDSPVGAFFATSPSGYSDTPPDTTLPVSSGSFSTSVTGSGSAYSNQKPYLGISFIICLFGIFPSRN